MKISYALGFPFRGPSAWANIGCALVCGLIPIIGPIVLLGYIIGIERQLMENLDADAPRFDFGKFSLYLGRGVHPFLASLLLALFLIPFVFVIVGLLLAGIFLMDRHAAAGALCIALAMLGYVLVLILFSIAIAPLVLKAGLEERVAAAFDHRFMLDYLKRVGLLTVGTNLLLFLIFLPCMLAVCIPIVGPYFVAAAALFIQAHVRMQLYAEYLHRGGIPITPKPELPDPAFPVIMSPPPPPPMPPNA